HRVVGGRVRRTDLQGRELFPPAGGARTNRRDRRADADRGGGSALVAARRGAATALLRRRAHDGHEGAGENRRVTVVDVLHPGEMGAAVAAALRARGETVLWASADRG